MFEFFSRMKDKIYKQKITDDIDKIHSLRKKFESLSDEMILNYSEDLKERVRSGVHVDDVLVEAYALGMEVIRRERGFLLHDNQLMCAMIISGYKTDSNNLAEMKTGEGKTLSGVLAAYLNALTGNGVHIITSNAHLAERDYEENKSIFDRLGITSGVVTELTESKDKKAIYDSDVVYASTYQIGFDYLRDNICLTKEEKVLRDLNYLIIDEVDDVILDQALVPMVISDVDKTRLRYDMMYVIDDFVKSLRKVEYNQESSSQNFFPTMRNNCDFYIERYDGNSQATLSESGHEKAEKLYKEFFKTDKLDDYYNDVFLPSINNAIYANYIIQPGNDYLSELTEEGIKIILIDSGTGRKLEGQKFSGGLHQAIQMFEAKKILQSSRYTLEEKEKAKKLDSLNVSKAFMTFPSFLKLYKTFTGMSGTLLESSKQLNELYGVDVISVPSNTPTKRVDNPIEIYPNSNGKLARIFELIKKHHECGQPILIGTLNISDSNFIADQIRKMGYEVVVLNADTKEEAELIKQAGKQKKITVATNLAGRGTDIKLDQISRENGGLCVIATSLNKSSRMDHQLCGRAGRQGDPGVSYMLTSLEDSVYVGMLDMVSGEFDINDVHKVQEKHENNTFEQIKNLNSFYFQIDIFREYYYNLRDVLIEGKDPIEIFSKLFTKDFICSELRDDSELDECVKCIENLKNISKNDIDMIRNALRVRMKKILPILDDYWGYYLEQIDFILNKINMTRFVPNSQFEQNIKETEVINDSFREFLSEILKVMLDANTREVIQEFAPVKEKGRNL